MMIRLLKEMVDHLLLLALHARYIGGVETLTTRGIDDIYNAVPREHKAIRQLVYYYLGTMVLSKQGIAVGDLLEKVVAVIEGKRRNVDGDLIDTLASTLKSAHGRNVLHSQLVESLSNAILLPDELGVVLTKLKQREMACGRIGCGHKFAPGEVAVFLNTSGPVSDGKQSGPTFYCVKCVSPTQITCTHCDKSAPLSKGATSMLRKEWECGCQASKDAEAKDAPPPDDIEVAPATTQQQQDAWDILRAATRNRPRPVRATPITPQTLRTGFNRPIGDDDGI